MRAFLAGVFFSMGLLGCATVDLGETGTAASAGPAADPVAAAPANSPAAAVSSMPVALLGAPDTSLPVQVDDKAIRTRISKDDMARSVAAPNPQDPPTRIVIDTSGVIRTTSLVNPRMIADRRVTGEKQVPNPNYAKAQQAVRDAEDKLREAEEANRSTQSSSKEMAATTGVGAWGAVLGGAVAVMGNSSVESAKQRVKDARSDAAEARQTISEPTYVQAEVPAVTQRTVLAGEVRIYRLDSRTRKVKVVVQPLQQAFDTQKKVEGTALVDAASPAGAPAMPMVDLKMAELAPRFDSAPEMAVEALAADMAATQARAQAQARTLETQAASETAAARDKLAQLAALSSAPAAAGTTATGGSGAQGDSASGGEACHMTGAFLSDRFPPFSQPTVEKVRTTMLASSLEEPMREANEKGISPEQTVQSFFDQATANDASAAQALKAAASVDAMGATDEEFMAKLKDNSLQLGDCQDIRSSSLCAAASYKMSAVFYRAMAAELDCHIRHGTWKK
jgi:hypothetical protein